MCDCIKLNISKYDPTKTKTIRDKWVSEVNRRFNSLKRDLIKQIYTDDWLELKNSTRIKTNYVFLNDADKVSNFNNWFRQQIDYRIYNNNLEVLNDSINWQNTYIDNSYKRGVKRSIEKHNDTAIGELTSQALLAPIHSERLQLLYIRAFDSLKGVTQEMSKQMSQSLADSLVSGFGAEKTAKLLSDRIDKIGRTRARLIGRTEVIRAHAEGTLTQFEQMDIKEVTGEVEWSTSGDNRVCPFCASLEGNIYTVKEARGKIPLHPNCRCAWLPVVGKIKQVSEQQIIGPTSLPEVTRQLMVSERIKESQRITKKIKEKREELALALKNKIPKLLEFARKSQKVINKHVDELIGLNTYKNNNIIKIKKIKYLNETKVPLIIKKIVKKSIKDVSKTTTLQAEAIEEIKFVNRKNGQFGTASYNLDKTITVNIGWNNFDELTTADEKLLVHALKHEIFHHISSQNNLSYAVYDKQTNWLWESKGPVDLFWKKRLKDKKIKKFTQMNKWNIRQNWDKELYGFKGAFHKPYMNRIYTRDIFTINKSGSAFVRKKVEAMPTEEFYAEASAFLNEPNNLIDLIHLDPELYEFILKLHAGEIK